MLSSLLTWFSRLIFGRSSTQNTSGTPDTPSSPLVPSPASSVSPSSPPTRRISIPWGEKVSQTFRDRIRWTAEALGIEVDWLMAVIAFESAETFRADIRNAAGSGATGLIQFMPTTAKGMGTSVEALAAMPPEDQINYVYRYLLPYKGRMRSLSDVYMAVLWPAAIGKPEDHVLWSRASHPTTYRQNAGLDANGDGMITKAEAAGKVREKLVRGQLYAWSGEVTVA